MATEGQRQGLYLVTDDCHEMECRVCGERFDLRKLDEVIAHEHRQAEENNNG